jgi:hypothetical protein
LHNLVAGLAGILAVNAAVAVSTDLLINFVIERPQFGGKYRRVPDYAH